MNAKPLFGEVALINDKLKFSCTVPERPPVTVDYAPPLGDGEGIMSLELFLMSLSTCFGSTLKYLITNRLQKEVNALSITVSGTRRKDHPTSFETVRLEVHLDAPGVAGDALTEVTATARKICPVAAMLNDTVEVTIEYRQKP